MYVVEVGLISMLRTTNTFIWKQVAFTADVREDTDFCRLSGCFMCSPVDN